MIGSNPWAKYRGQPARPRDGGGLLDRELTESMQDVQSVFGILDEMYDPATGERWMPLLSGGTTPYGEQATVFATEQGQTLMRVMCRYLADENEFAINALENRVNYIVGTGMAMRFEPRDPTIDTDAPQVKAELKKLNALLKDELDLIDFDCKQEEIVRRSDRDGETFLRRFASYDTVEYRYVEPAEVSSNRAPGGRAPFGIETEPGDVTKVLHYWIDGQPIEAAEVYHFKANVDTNVRRGRSTLWPIRKNLHRAAKLLKGISTQAQYQASISAIRTHDVGDANTVRNFADNRANYQITEPATGASRRLEKINAGRVIDTTSRIKWEFPSVGVGMDKLVIALQADLRGAAARLVMPEYMFTSDASNGTYASLMASDGPSYRMLARAQKRHAAFFVLIATDVVTVAQAAGRIPANTLDRYRVVAVPPDIANHDPKVDAEANQIKYNAGVLSARTWATRDGLDYDRERQNRLDDDDQDATSLPPIDPKGKKVPAGEPDDEATDD